MKNFIYIAMGGACLALLVLNAPAAEPAAGWRGNATGLWPDAKAPIEWKRLAHGALEGMRAQADRPMLSSEGKAPKAPKVRKGLIAEWLVLATPRRISTMI
jgi:hypothetical protein